MHMIRKFIPMLLTCYVMTVAVLAQSDPPMQKPLVRSEIVLRANCIKLTTGVAPPEAKPAGQDLTVAVELLIDETGLVISSHARSGLPLLRIVAEQVSKGCRFKPFL